MVEKKFDYKTALSNLPQETGVYIFYDINDIIIYIGKAKNIKKRVSSYFANKNFKNKKSLILSKKIQRISYTIVGSEFDSLLLENNLIKRHQPKYNILLKDDKSYPWIAIKNERFPRVIFTRKVIKDGSKYFGPYASVDVLRKILDFISEIFQLRNCNYVLSEKNIAQKKFKVCLEYQLKNCKGPCEAFETEEQYLMAIKNIEHILKGNIKDVIKFYEKKIDDLVSNVEFEEAHLEKNRLLKLKQYQSKSAIVSQNLSNIDVFSIIENEKFAVANFLKVVNGSVVHTQTIELNKKLDETIEELLSIAILEFRQRFKSNSKEIIVPFLPNICSSDLKYNIPKSGDKFKLLELSKRNSFIYLKDKIKNEEHINPETKIQNRLHDLKNDLNLDTLPSTIECIDNSNIQGKHPASAVVVFKDLKPSKKDYRKYHVKTIEGADDYGTMKEIIFRRYSRMLTEKTPLPQLLIVDGGKGQLSAVMTVLNELKIANQINTVAIAKRLEEIYAPNESIPLLLKKDSFSLKIIQQIRNEAHRFALKTHREKRSKEIIFSELGKVNGFGKTSIEKILTKYKSIEQALLANDEELAGVLNKKQIKNLREYFSR